MKTNDKTLIEAAQDRARTAANDSMLPQTVWRTKDPDEPWISGSFVWEPCTVENYAGSVPLFTVLPGRYLTQ